MQHAHIVIQEAIGDAALADSGSRTQHRMLSRHRTGYNVWNMGALGSNGAGIRSFCRVSVMPSSIVWLRDHNMLMLVVKASSIGCSEEKPRHHDKWQIMPLLATCAWRRSSLSAKTLDACCLCKYSYQGFPKEVIKVML